MAAWKGHWPSKRWPSDYYAALARRLAADGNTIWVIGGPEEKAAAAQIAAADPAHIRDLTGSDLRNAILAPAGLSVAQLRQARYSSR